MDNNNNETIRIEEDEEESCYNYGPVRIANTVPPPAKFERETEIENDDESGFYHMPLNVY